MTRVTRKQNFKVFVVVIPKEGWANMDNAMDNNKDLKGHVKNNEAPPNSTYQGNLFGSAA